jgi:hypothetical protein
VTNQPTTKEEVIVTQTKAMLTPEARNGFVTYLNDKGIETVSSHLTLASWGGEVWYQMIDVIDAPWTQLCLLSSVVSFLPSVKSNDK